MDRPRKNDQQSGDDSEEEVQSIYRGLPIAFKNYIRAAEWDESMFIDDEVLVIQKPLSNRDVDPQKGRFSFPPNSVMEDYQKDAGLVDLIDPSAQRHTLVYFRVKKKKKKEKNSGKDSTMYVLDTTWNEVVTRNNLEAGQIVQLWAVGIERTYGMEPTYGMERANYFALQRLTTEEGNNAPGGSDAAANPSSSSSSSASSDS